MRYCNLINNLIIRCSINKVKCCSTYCLFSFLFVFSYFCLFLVFLLSFFVIMIFLEIYPRNQQPCHPNLLLTRANCSSDSYSFFLSFIVIFSFIFIFVLRSIFVIIIFLETYPRNQQPCDPNVQLTRANCCCSYWCYKWCDQKCSSDAFCTPGAAMLCLVCCPIAPCFFSYWLCCDPEFWDS